MKRYLLLTCYFKPEFTGIAVHASELAEELRSKGHRVDVLAAMPFYPDWCIWRKYKGKLFYKEDLGGINVFRNWLYVPSHKRGITTSQRMIHEASFALLQVVNAFLHLRMVLRADQVIVFSPPFLQSVNALALSLFLRKKTVFHVEDIQPDSAVNLGMIGHGFVTRSIIPLLRLLERATYQSSYRVSTLTHGMAENLRGKLGRSQNKVLLFPYWVDFDVFRRDEDAGRRFRAKLKLSESFLLVGYAGNLGRKQRLGYLLRLASTHALDTQIKIIIAGEGAEKSKLMARKRDLRLTNVEFLPLMRGQDYVDFLNGVDLSYLSQDESADKIFIPSKLYKILSCGSPVLCVANENSELAKIVISAGAGFVVSFKETSETVSLLNGLVGKRTSLGRFRAPAASFARGKYDKTRIISDFLDGIGVA